MLILRDLVCCRLKPYATTNEKFGSSAGFYINTKKKFQYKCSSLAAASEGIPAGNLKSSNAVSRAAERAARLESMLALRRLYRNLLRAEPLLQLASPVYVPYDKTTSDNDQSLGAGDTADAEAQARIDEAVALVAEMELTAEELRLGIKALKAAPQRYGELFDTEDPEEIENRIEGKVREVYRDLVERVGQELPTLPFPSQGAAQAAIDTRNAKYRSSAVSITFSGMDGTFSDGEGAPEGGYLGPEARRGFGERLEEAERFVSKKLQPAVARVRHEVSSPVDVIEGFQRSASWAKGLWARLNGGARSSSSAAPADLPLPQNTAEIQAATVEQLNSEIEELESKLQDASKARETRLRKAGIQGRARIASELREMDNEVVALSRALAVRTLQLEMEFIYGCLEEESLDVIGDPSAKPATASGGGGDPLALALSRRGSTDEVALLAAEFRQLDTDLSDLAAEVEAGGALVLDDGVLAGLATEIPDLRIRLGVGDTTVFGGTGISLGKVQMQLRNALLKIWEALMFGVRGVRLLSSDIGAAGRLFWRAIVGGTLKPREVAALRRTARDLLTFVPFTIILILPLTPVGHVLIFGFIQRYFPGFFPSQFTSRRQDLMIKYEQLKKQLQEAQSELERENDQVEFERAAALLAAKSQAVGEDPTKKKIIDVNSKHADASETESSGLGGGGDSDVKSTEESDEDEDGSAAAVVKKLEEELAAAADSSYTDLED